MQATLVGTGTAFSRRFGNTNSLIENGDVKLMIDFGFTTPGRLEDLGRNLREITHIAISHIHADHVGGLEELAFLSRFVFGSRPRLLLPEGLASDIWEHSLKGGMEMISDERGNPCVCTIETYFEPVVLGTEWTDLGGLEIRAFANDHVPGKASYGFLVRAPETGDTMVFGCDVRRRLVELEADPLHPDFASGPIFHDCQMYDDGPSGVHITFPELCRYRPEIRERIILVHYNDSVLDHLERIRDEGFRIAWPSDVVTMPDWHSCFRELRPRRQGTR